MYFVASLLALHSATCDHWGTPAPTPQKISPPRAENVAETWPAAAYQLDPTNADGMPNFILCWGWGASEVFHVVAAMRCVRRETRAVRHPRHLPRPTPSNPQTPSNRRRPLHEEHTESDRRQARLPFRKPRLPRAATWLSSDPQPNCPQRWLPVFDK